MERPKCYTITEEWWGEYHQWQEQQNHYSGIPEGCPVFLKRETAEAKARHLCAKAAEEEQWKQDTRIDWEGNEYYVAYRPDDSKSTGFYDWVEYRIMEHELCDTAADKS